MKDVQARWAPTRDEEHAVSMLTLGPWQTMDKQGSLIFGIKGGQGERGHEHARDLQGGQGERGHERVRELCPLQPHLVSCQ